MENPKYTFLLPAYKGRFLKEMLDSIQGQTYTNFKVLISDDCSPEDLYSICKPYLEDPRFEYRRNEKNIGAEHLVDHWNLLLDLCDTEYCIMAGDDDVYDARYLECIDSIADSYHTVLRPRIRYVDECGNALLTESTYMKSISSTEFMSLWIGNQLSPGIPYYCFKTKTLLQIGGFVDFPYACFSDDATVLKVADCGGLAMYDEVLFSFRSSAYSISGSQMGYRQIIGHIDASSAFFDLARRMFPDQYLLRQRICGVVLPVLCRCSNYIFLRALSHILFNNWQLYNLRTLFGVIRSRLRI